MGDLIGLAMYNPNNDQLVFELTIASAVFYVISIALTNELALCLLYVYGNSKTINCLFYTNVMSMKLTKQLSTLFNLYLWK